MDAILVDQITAIFVVLSVAMAIFGGIYAYIWRLSGQAGQSGSPIVSGLAGMVALWGAFALLAVAKAVTAIDVMLVIAAVSVLAAWLLIFSALWRLDSVTR